MSLCLGECVGSCRGNKGSWWDYSVLFVVRIGGQVYGRRSGRTLCVVCVGRVGGLISMCRENRGIGGTIISSMFKIIC